MVILLTPPRENSSANFKLSSIDKSRDGFLQKFP
jgi:hypothetical protein